MLAIEPAVTWIKVEKPTFDLVGVVLGSFHLAGRPPRSWPSSSASSSASPSSVSRRRPASPTPLDEVSLHLDA